MKPNEAAPVGRPSKYDSIFCEMLIEHMSEGLSFESFAATIGTHRDTLYQWTKTHSDFSDAKKIACEASCLFWEKMGIEGLYTSKETTFNTGVWIFNMKNRHGWRDKPDEAIRIEVNPIKDKLKALSTEELVALVKDSKAV